MTLEALVHIGEGSGRPGDALGQHLLLVSDGKELGRLALERRRFGLDAVGEAQRERCRLQRRRRTG